MTSLAWIAACLAPQEADYAAAMKKVAERFTGKPGVVLHVGDSTTIANPYTTWARQGKGKTPADEAVLKWMHTGAKDDTDGWHLCRTEVAKYVSATAASGLRLDRLLAGGTKGMPSLAELLRKYNPQVVVLKLGHYDAEAGRKVADYKADLARAVDLMLANGTIPILTTIPLYAPQEELHRSYNAAVGEVAAEKKVPLLDLFAEIVKRRPHDWRGKLTDEKGCHLSAGADGVTPASEPTEENLRNCGYLLRGWLTVRKIAEVKERVLDRP
jgi:hypothetical protein